MWNYSWSIRESQQLKYYQHARKPSNAIRRTHESLQN